MKLIRLQVILFLITLFPVVTTQAHAQEQTGEAVNMTDEKGYRQGYWKITGAMSIEGGYKKNQVVEEGKYVDNKREGVWKKYYPSGTLQSEITYSNNHPKGDYKIYYFNGNLEEESTWAYNKNKGAFRRYHENGTLAQEFNFADNGKRTGTQKYYYDNGNPQMTVEVVNGTAEGKMIRYYADGTVKEEKTFVNGQLDESTVKTYPAKSELAKNTKFPELPRAETASRESDDKPNLEAFKANGFNTLYNRNRQVSQIGEFKNGKLYNGKWNRYDENGLLKKIEIYKEGRFIGYGVIEDDMN